MFIVGDLHGDLDQARCALEMAGVLSSEGDDLWIGGETVCFNLCYTECRNIFAATPFYSQVTLGKLFIKKICTALKLIFAKTGDVGVDSAWRYT